MVYDVNAGRSDATMLIAGEKVMSGLIVRPSIVAMRSVSIVVPAHICINGDRPQLGDPNGRRRGPKATCMNDMKISL
jgi:hypothetical protein